MTQLDVMYLYGEVPGEAAMKALGQIRKVYGVRLVELREAEKMIRVEYDATRLSEPIIHQLLRGAGIDVLEQVSLIPPQPEAAAPAAS
ncbi:MAG: hypothetical protein ACLGQX_09710 [Acidobacteriota bacterium]|jgi:hypothetical protein